MNKFISLILILFMCFKCTCISPKIIGLMQVRNEESIIEQSLKALAMYTDAIVILDDCSSDKTLEIVESLKEKLNIEKIIKNSESAWMYKTELHNKQLLLDSGRSLSGTHFIYLDADEFFSANCLENNWLKNQILSLEKGQVATMRVVDTWKGIDYYRDDTHISPNKVGFGVIMYDDGVCNWFENFKTSPSGFIHSGRFPVCNEVINIKDGEHFLIHFKYVDFNFLKIKIAWYMCLERIRLTENLSQSKPDRTIADINKYYSFYQPCFQDEHIVLRPFKKIWLNYPDFDLKPFYKQHVWRKKEILTWFNQYGKDYFKELNIWNIGIDWN